ncbi:MAG: hypothetical protein ACRDYU_11485 [Actinomycetes bacterium]
MQGRSWQVFVDPTGRRHRVARRAATGIGTSFLCFLSVLTAGPLLGSQPVDTESPLMPERVSGAHVVDQSSSPESNAGDDRASCESLSSHRHDG